MVRRISVHVERLWTIHLSADEANEREIASYFSRRLRLAVVCSHNASGAILPFYWGLGMLGFRVSLEPEADASGASMLPLLDALKHADVVVFALYPPAMPLWFFDACYTRAGSKARFVVFGGLTIDHVRQQYPALAAEPASRFVHKRMVGFPLTGDQVLDETWRPIEVILRG